MKTENKQEIFEEKFLKDHGLQNIGQTEDIIEELIIDYGTKKEIDEYKRFFKKMKHKIIPLDEKTFGKGDWKDVPDGYLCVEDTKNSLQNLQEELKEETAKFRNLVINKNTISKNFIEIPDFNYRLNLLEDELNKAFLKHIGKRLLKENEKQNKKAD